MGDKPTIPEVIDAFVDYLAGNDSWGSLHIVLADGNLHDDFVRFCIDYAVENGDAAGICLGGILLRMSKTQRGKIGSVAREKLNRRQQSQSRKGA